MSTKYANSALSSTKSAATFALQMLRDEQKRLERGERMHTLWKESGLPQKVIAERLGLEHRSYQKALQTGGISYEKAEVLAELHGVDVDWLWSGREREATPSLNGGGPTDLAAQVAALVEVVQDDLLPSLSRLEEVVVGNAQALERIEAGGSKPPARRAKRSS